MTRCCALNCKNTGVHAFPKDRKRRKAWEDAVRIKNFKAKDSSRLCSKHFTTDDYFGQSKYTAYAPRAKFLKKTAVPSIFSFTVKKLESTSTVARRQRLEKRSQRELVVQKKITPSHSHNARNDVSKGQEVNEEIEILPNSVEIGAEVDISVETNYSIIPGVKEKEYLENSSKSTQMDIEFAFGSIDRFKDDDEGILFYTGFESYRKFFFVYSTLSPMVHKIHYFGSPVTKLSPENQLFLTMMKLRQNKCIFELSRFFNISSETVSNVFITWVNFMYQVWSEINIWPSKDLVQHYMPEKFKKYDTNVRVILDEIEIHVEKQKHLTAKEASRNGPANTLKVLVGATPGGLLSFCSPAFAGSVSNRQIVEVSDLMNKCESGDCILADDNFNIQGMFAVKNVSVNNPPFLKDKIPLPGLTVVKNNKRVHIERVIGLTETYRILKGDLDHSYVPIANKIFFICIMCCNFRENTVK